MPKLLLIRYIVLLALLFAGVGPTLAEQPGADQRPNVVLILADDMGYSDLGCYGGEIPTPHLDALAHAGLRFTNFYSENMCVASRAAMLTGVYTKTSLRNKRLNRRCVTIAEALREHGYTTAMAGKWHLGQADDATTLPPARGFDSFFGTIYGAGSFFAPASLMRDTKSAEDEFQNADFYYTDAISDNAVRFIDAAPQQQPLFLYVAYTAAHWPLHAREKDIDKFKGQYALGWDELRRQRFARMKKLGVIPQSTRLSPRDDDVLSWEDAKNQAWQQRRMEVYAAQVEVMDQGIGRIVDSLRRNGRLDNTLILFGIDNGGCHVEYTQKRKGNYLPETTRDGRVVLPGNLPHIMPGPEETYQSYGRGWANASNTPYRLFKQYAHEGGIRTPLIAHWPKRIKNRGGLTHQIAHVIDITPTVLQATGCPYPQEFAGRPIHPYDGRSLTGVLSGQKAAGREALFWQWAHGKAVRAGRWKLVRRDQQPWELYDIVSDFTELTDLASQQPDKVTELTAMWQAWEKRNRQRE